MQPTTGLAGGQGDGQDRDVANPPESGVQDGPPAETAGGGTDQREGRATQAGEKLSVEAVRTSALRADSRCASGGSLPTRSTDSYTLPASRRTARSS